MSEYRGEVFALLTRHGKELVIASEFASTLGAEVQRVDGFDTDSLGTFTRDIPRAGSQLDAVRTKARIGMDLSGLLLGLASEGSFTPGPFGLGSNNLELVILLDTRRGIEILGRSQAPARHVGVLTRTKAEFDHAVRLAGFPEHGVVLRPVGGEDPRISRDLRSWDLLHEAFADLQGKAPNGAVFVESDLRAHRNPTRMANIAAATTDLIRRMLSICSACGSPGFWLVARAPGLACRECGSATLEARAEQYGCVACEHIEWREVMARHADPSQCESCNP